jgi:hypothetical protein
MIPLSVEMAIPEVLSGLPLEMQLSTFAHTRPLLYCRLQSFRYQVGGTTSSTPLLDQHDTHIAGHHLSVIGDILGVPLRTYRKIHRAGGMMTLTLWISHTVIVPATKTAFPLETAENKWGLIVS